jgi:hypothetical protein
MSLKELQWSVMRFQKEKEEVKKRILESCVPPPPEMTEEAKRKWMDGVLSLLETRANKGKTDFALELFEGFSAFHHKRENRDAPDFHFKSDAGSHWRSRDKVPGFEKDSMHYEGFMTDHEDSLVVPPGFFFWSMDCRINIFRDPDDDVVTLARQRFARFMWDIQSSLCNYWRMHSDIPVKSTTSEPRGNNFRVLQETYGLCFDWSAAAAEKKVAEASEGKRARTEHLTEHQECAFCQKKAKATAEDLGDDDNDDDDDEDNEDNGGDGWGGSSYPPSMSLP